MMNSSEYWILRYVIYGREPVGSLAAREKDFGEWFNAPFHGLSLDELEVVLEALFQRGDIDAEWRAREAPAFSPTRQQLRRALAAHSILDPELFDYGLTPQGGQRWEQAAQPDWTRFFRVEGTPESTDTLISYIITATSQERAEELFTCRTRSYSVISAHRETLRPWQATYWKVLPAGFRIHYQYDGKPNLDAPVTDCFATTWTQWITDPSPP